MRPTSERTTTWSDIFICALSKALPAKAVDLSSIGAQQTSGLGLITNGKGLNRYSNVHIDDLVDLYMLAIEKTPAASFFFAENGDASFKEIAESISRSLGLGGRTQSLNVADVIQ
jgi:nucleoside-diphosphate-sugar epimerase